MKYRIVIALLLHSWISKAAYATITTKINIKWFFRVGDEFASSSSLSYAGLFQPLL